MIAFVRVVLARTPPSAAMLKHAPGCGPPEGRCTCCQPGSATTGSSTGSADAQRTNPARVAMVATPMPAGALGRLWLPPAAWGGSCHPQVDPGHRYMQCNAHAKASQPLARCYDLQRSTRVRKAQGWLHLRASAYQRRPPPCVRCCCRPACPEGHMTTSKRLSDCRVCRAAGKACTAGEGGGASACSCHGSALLQTCGHAHLEYWFGGPFCDEE